MVLLQAFELSRPAVPAALLRAAVDPRRLRHGSPRPGFAKVLGTADGRTFSPRDADLSRWVVLTVWDDAADADRFTAAHPTARAWSRLARRTVTLRLRPLSSRGRWSGREPFAGAPLPSYDGPVAALTRARVRPRRLATFWRAVPPVAAAAAASPGLLWSLGIGEAPLAFQGTLSVWESRAAMREFAYARPEHRRAIRRTHEVGWYAEELFATFAVVAVKGLPAGVEAGGGAAGGGEAGA